LNFENFLSFFITLNSRVVALGIVRINARLRNVIKTILR